MKVLITGITGFVGSYMARYCLEKGALVYGFCRKGSSTERIKDILPQIRIVETDLLDEYGVFSALGKIKPHLIFHLAAQSYVSQAWDMPMYTLKVNVMGQLNLLEAIRRWGLNCKVLVSCSSSEYGMVNPQDVPVKEDTPLRPIDPYGVSKVAQDVMAYQYYKGYGIPIIRMRAFNHTGWGRDERFVESSFAKQSVEIKMGLREAVVKVGNLSTKRDFLHVKDVVRGYWMAMEKGKEGEVYNICSGKAYSMKYILEKILNIVGVEAKVEVDAAKVRSVDIPVIFGDYSKLKQDTNWSPSFSIDEILEDVVSYWGQVMSKEFY